MIAALFVDPKGPYPKLAGVECWDRQRDAFGYTGEDPVVAHPPCNLWVNLAALNFKRYGGDHNRPGNDGGAFAFALATVRRCGGVLEHPASSKAWTAHGLIPPVGVGWELTIWGDWICEVWQSAYGHKARKRTWLLYVGAEPPLEARWDREPGTHWVGWDYRLDRTRPSLGKREASRTPTAFAEFLVALARHAGASSRP